MPGQMMMGQPSGMMPQGGLPVRMPQGQPQNPGALGPRPPGPPAIPAGFFPQGHGVHGTDPRLLQDRQLQHRLQMAKLQQQQAMMGQHPMSHPGQQPGMVPHPGQQPGMLPQPPTGMMGNTFIGPQQQANIQQGMPLDQASQQGMVQVPQGMVGGQPVPQLPQNTVGQPPAMMSAQAGMMGNQPVGPSQQQQRSPLLMGPQGIVVSPGHPGVRGPQAQLTPQQQNILAQRMISQQQMQQQQMAQKRQQSQGPINQPNQEQGTTQPSVPQMGSSPSAGSTAPQHQGSSEGLQQAFQQDAQNPGLKEKTILSQAPRTPTQHSGPSTPSPMAQQGSAAEQHIELAQQQQQNPAYTVQNQPPNAQQQPGLAVNHQAGMSSQVQPQSALVTIKQERQQMDVPNVPQQSQDPSTLQHEGMGQLQNVMGHNNTGGQMQPQPAMMGHPSPQQQALMAQQQKQQAMMGMMRAQQPGMMAQRPGVPTGQIRMPINIQAIIAQNPQLRNLPPNQQIQHIQAMITQRQLQQGQMMRMSAQGQPGQMRPQMAPSQVQQVGQRTPSMEGQQMHFAAVGKPGAGGPQQPGMLGQQPGMPPQMQQGMMVQGQQQQQVGQMMQQQMIRGQMPMVGSPMDQSRMVRPMSPHQSLPNSPGDPQRHAMAQAMGMRPPTPSQQQAHAVAAAGRMPGSPSHAGSPRGSTVQRMDNSPSTPGTPHSTHVPSPSLAEGGAGRGSPYHQIRASPLRSPGAKSPHHFQGLKAEPHTSGNEMPQTSSLSVNGPQQDERMQQHLQQKAPGVHATQPGSRDGDLCRVTLQNIKLEPREVQCDGKSAAEALPGAVKREAGGELINCGFTSAENLGGDPATQARSETGQQLLQKLLRTKNLQLAAQRPTEGIHNEINGHINNKLAMLEQKLQGTPRNMEVSSVIRNLSPHILYHIP